MLLLSQRENQHRLADFARQDSSDGDAVGDADRLLGWSAIRCGLFADVATILSR
jgi:hypothetical protein